MLCCDGCGGLVPIRLARVCKAAGWGRATEDDRQEYCSAACKQRAYRQRRAAAAAG